jgi:hypothetical protein
MKSESLKLLGRHKGETLQDEGICNEFLYRTLKGQVLRKRTDKWNCIKLKSFFTDKETI